VLLECAERLAAGGRSDEAVAPLDEARAIFEGLGARPYLERIERVPVPLSRAGAEAAS